MVTTIEELKKMRNTFEAELPPFADGSKLVVLLKKPSVFDMVLNGKKLNAVDEQLVTRLPLYNKIYEDYIEKCKSGYKLYEGKQ